MKKNIVFILVILIAGLILNQIEQKNKPIAFEDLGNKEMLTRIIKERDIAIEKATEEGVYKCCIRPACTMCFMEANKWNNFEAGTCACDDLIAEGKEPCPQCKNGLCNKSEEGLCKVNKLD